ncbi:pilin [Patescibacteria group bacterium]|nr:pilin [Patescibacteria group bacterium]
MLKIISKKLSFIALIAILFVSLAPISLAQDYTSPLDDIKEKLEGEGIDVIDYSENVWGKLSGRIITILEGEGYSGMDVIAEDLNLEELDNELNEIDELSLDDIELIKNEAIAYQYSGERQLRDTVQGVVRVIRNLIASLAVIWIVISGIRMVTAQGEESVITEQKRSIIYAVIGLVSILLIERLIDILYGTPGTYVGTYGGDYVNVFEPGATEARFSAEIYGVVNFIKAVIASIAILMIVISGVKTIMAQGEEEAITKQRKVFLWVIIGLILFAIDQTIVDNFFAIPVQQQEGVIQASNVTAIINTIGKILQFLLGFVGLIALGMLIYGAGTMIANYGNDEMVQKAKKIIKNALIGIIVIISAYTLVATLIVFK